MVTPKVSAFLITYNQERYIAQAIESVLMQRTSFPIELVIGEDCSTDRTREIVCDYQARYPDIIRAILPDTNQGPFKNVETGLAACRGQYIASLEGDDYWTDPEKLQLQADFLDAHPECSISFHTACMINEDGVFPPTVVPQEARHLKEMLTVADLVETNFIPTCSALWRRALFDGLPEWVSEIGMSDWPINILMAKRGHIGLVNRCMGVYRIHDGGIWSTRTVQSRLESWVKAHEYIDRELDYRYHRPITIAKFKRLYIHALNCISSSDVDARRYVWRTLRTGPPHVCTQQKIALALRLHAPPLLSLCSGIKRALYNPHRNRRGFEPAD